VVAATAAATTMAASDGSVGHLPNGRSGETRLRLAHTGLHRPEGLVGVCVVLRSCRGRDADKPFRLLGPQ
jgi:hypothetical protein